MKQLFRIFLSLSLLLLSGYNNIYAHTSGEAVSYSAKISGIEAQARFGKVLHAGAPATQFSTLIAEDEDEKLFYEEVEEEQKEQAYLKCRSNYFSDFYGHVPGNLCNTSQKCSPSAGHFSFSSACRYILFRTFRI